MGGKYDTLYSATWILQSLHLEFNQLVFAYTELLTSVPKLCFSAGVPFPDTVDNAPLETLELAATIQNEVRAMHNYATLTHLIPVYHYFPGCRNRVGC